MAQINLKRPLTFLDFETTGVDTNKSKIVSACFIKVTPEGDFQEVNYLINPQCPIPLEASAVHGITDEMVKDCPTFGIVGPEMALFLEDSDIAGFNSNNFDVPLFIEECKRVGINFSTRGRDFIDVRNLYTILKPRTLTAAYKDYTGEDLDGAHDASADVKATIRVFMSMFASHTDLPTEVKELAIFGNYGKQIIDICGKFTLNEEGKIIFTFGQHKGKEAASERNYLNWILKSDFATPTKDVAAQILNGELY